MGYIADGGTFPPPAPAITYASRTGTVSAFTAQAAGTISRAGSVTRRAARKKATRVADTSGTTLVTNDASGFGLSRPYLPWNWYANNLEANPAAAPVFSTTSASFVALVTCASEPQHPRLRVRVRVVTGAGTSGEVRLRDRVTGQVLTGGGPLVVGVATTVESNLDGTLVAPSLAGAGAPMKVDVEARITAGANTIAVLIVYALGIGT